MCGIHGFNSENKGLLEAMIATAKHRGPDGAGEYVQNGISLGHNLLAITEEPELGRQPWLVENGKYVLVYNGEIYNYTDLRKQLINKGIKFSTDCDTEVLAKGLAENGLDFIKKVDGMFAFAWLDTSQKTLTLGRDKNGAKPLYYRNLNGSIAFSSELKSLLLHSPNRKINRFALSLYFEFGYVPGKLTLLQGIYKLMPGEIQSYSYISGKLNKRWTLNDHFPVADGKAVFDPTLFRRKIYDGVGKCLVGRAPIGLYLSGGLDSAMVCREVAKHKKNIATFSTRFESPTPSLDKEFNRDAEIAGKLSRVHGFDHANITVTENMFIENMERTVLALEEPRYNKSTPAYLLTAEFLKQNGITVTLSGDGGDELYSGYVKRNEISRQFSFYAKSHRKYKDEVYRELYDYDVRRDHLPDGISWFDYDDPFCRWYYLTKFTKHSRLSEIGVDYNFDDLINYIKQSSPQISYSKDPENDELFLETIHWLADECLIRNDKLGMFFGMEARFPLLTQDVKEYSFSLSASQKYSFGNYKRWPREAYKDIFFDSLLNKEKSGWAAPAAHWYKTELGRFMRNILTTDYYEPLSKYINYEKVKSTNNLKVIFSATYLAIWARQIGAE